MDRSPKLDTPVLVLVLVLLDLGPAQIAHLPVDDMRRWAMKSSVEYRAVAVASYRLSNASNPSDLSDFLAQRKDYLVFEQREGKR